MVKRKKDLSSQKCAKLILECIQKDSYQPITIEELFIKIHPSLSSSSAFQLAIDTLIKGNQICLRKKKLYPIKQDQEQILNGTLRLHPKGFGFVIPNERKMASRYFYSKNYTESAIDGDLVTVAVNTNSSSEKGPEGKSFLF